jgi:hypothetical protein
MYLFNRISSSSCFAFGISFACFLLFANFRAVDFETAPGMEGMFFPADGPDFRDFLEDPCAEPFLFPDAAPLFWVPRNVTIIYLSLNGL